MIALVATCGAVSAPAHAQPAPATTEAPVVSEASPSPAAEASRESDSEASVADARRRYAQGSEFYRRGRYTEAIAEFTEAYRLWSNPTILYALGQAYEGSSEVPRAIETYQRYLETAPADDIRRADVTRKIEELEGLLATVHVASNVDAAVYLDGERIGDAPGDVLVSTGRHQIELRAEGYESQSATVSIAGGTERTVTFELVALASTLVRVERERFRFPRPVFFTAVGLSGAALVTWGSMATVAVVRAREYNDTPGSTNFDREQARDAARRSNVALGVAGGVVGVTALVGVLTRWRDDDDEPPTPVVATIEPVVGGAVISTRWTR